MTHRPTVTAYAGMISAGPFQLPYVIEGTGSSAIVIGSSRYYPRVFSPNLRKHLRLVFMDHRGFAPSPGPVDTSEFELPKLIDDVETLRQRLGLGRVVVIGHSGNAYMALEYGKKYPAHASHVVMIGIAPDLSQDSAALAERNYEALADADRLAAERENKRALPDEELATLPPDQAFVRSYIRNAARVWYDPRFDCTPLWQDVKNLTIRVFERSGHTPQLEEAELFDEQLVKWLEETSPRAGAV